jgi:hypothetical protein
MLAVAKNGGVMSQAKEDFFQCDRISSLLTKGARSRLRLSLQDCKADNFEQADKHIAISSKRTLPDDPIAVFIAAEGRCAWRSLGGNRS